MQETARTVKYSVSDDVKFDKIALKLGRSKRLVVSEIVEYFYRSKKDPTYLNGTCSSVLIFLLRLPLCYLKVRSHEWQLTFFTAWRVLSF